MSRQKLLRRLAWDRALWRPWYHPESETVRVRLTDPAEPDRIHLLVMSPEDARVLAQLLTSRLPLTEEG